MEQKHSVKSRLFYQKKKNVKSKWDNVHQIMTWPVSERLFTLGIKSLHTPVKMESFCEVKKFEQR